MDLIKLVQKHAQADRSQRFRDSRAFYASSAMSCLRDQYWSATGEKATNPPDLVGKLKMMVGSAVEAGIIKEFFGDLHWYGLHLLGTQVPVGGSNPNWDGYLDALVFDKETKSKYVIELKTKSGYGADLLYESCEPSEEYLAQLGLYLKDLSEKGVTNEGCLMYVLLSDKHFGTLLQIDCRYEAETQDIVATRTSCSDGTGRDLNIRFSIKKVLERWKMLENCIKDKVVPKPDYKYKYDLTPEFIDSVSDANMRKMIDNAKVMGDWNVLYSRFFNKILLTDGIQKGYTNEELEVLKTAYRARHPRSKV